VLLLSASRKQNLTLTNISQQEAEASFVTAISYQEAEQSCVAAISYQEADTSRITTVQDLGIVT
jgi:hypothetical protein